MFMFQDTSCSSCYVYVSGYKLLCLCFRIQQLPEELPKINFAHYKSRLSTPAMVDEFEKMVCSDNFLRLVLVAWPAYLLHTHK